MEKHTKRKTSAPNGILVSLFTFIVLLFIGEMIIRLIYPLIVNYDLEMWRYAAFGKVLTPDGHMNRSNAHFNDLYGVEVKINSKALRDREYSYEKPENTYRILLLGDSITFGWGVPFEKTYAEKLEKKLNTDKNPLKYEIINTGVGNYGTGNEVAFLEHEGLKYDPDMIILAFFVNDAEINPGIKYYSLKRHSYLYAFFWSKWNALLTRFKPDRTFKDYYRSLYNENTATRKTIEAHFSELISIAGARNIPLLVIIIPDLHELKDYPFNEIHDLVTYSFTGHPDVEVLDLLPYFDTEVDPISYWVSSEDAHHNAKAHDVIAEAVYPKISAMSNAGRVHDE